jgi:hypothetical protein
LELEPKCVRRQLGHEPFADVAEVIVLRTADQSQPAGELFFHRVAEVGFLLLREDR